jgi:hypothetical protein
MSATLHSDRRAASGDRHPLAIKTTLMTEQLDLTDEEKRALIALLRRTLDYTRYPAHRGSTR